MNKEERVLRASRRFELCTRVATTLAKLFETGTSVAKVALYGSVARTAHDHWCGDVDLMLFIRDPQLVTRVGFAIEGGRERMLLSELGLADRAEEIKLACRGFLTQEEFEKRAGDADLVRETIVPVSVQLLPYPFTIEALCDFQRDQWDPMFLEKIGRDVKIHGEHGFRYEGVPWANLKLAIHQDSCTGRHALPEVQPMVSLIEAFAEDEKPWDENSGFKVLGRTYYDCCQTCFNLSCDGDCCSGCCAQKGEPCAPNCSFST